MGRRGACSVGRSKRQARATQRLLGRQAAPLLPGQRRGQASERQQGALVGRELCGGGGPSVSPLTRRRWRRRHRGTASSLSSCRCLQQQLCTHGATRHTRGLGHPASAPLLTNLQVCGGWLGLRLVSAGGQWSQHCEWRRAGGRRGFGAGARPRGAMQRLLRRWCRRRNWPGSQAACPRRGTVTPLGSSNSRGITHLLRQARYRWLRC